MTRWIALVPCRESVTGYLLEGDKIQSRFAGSSESRVLNELGAAPRIIRVGDGPPDRLPTSILPDAGNGFAALEQSNPPDILSATVRLWIAGALATRPHWDGVFCVTQEDVTHWVHISAGEAVSAQSVLTPRLIHALGGSLDADAHAVADTLSRPERLAAHLRQAEILANREAITGHLVGAELAATRPYWLGQEVLLIAKAQAVPESALKAQGVPVTRLDPEDLVGPGLAALGRALALSED